MTSKITIKTKIDLSPLDDLIKALDEKMFTKVGLIGGKGKAIHSKSEDSNATIGLMHELGSKTKNIKRRSFLRFPLEFKSDDLINILIDNRKKILEELLKGNGKFLYETLGIGAEIIIQQAFSTSGFGQWPALSERTIREKGSSKQLIDTSELRRAVTSKAVKNV